MKDKIFTKEDLAIYQYGKHSEGAWWCGLLAVINAIQFVIGHPVLSAIGCGMSLLAYLLHSERKRAIETMYPNLKDSLKKQF